MHAFEIANKAGLTEDELEDQERREIFIKDQRGALQYAATVGERKGEIQGRIKGKQEVAKSMLEKGMAKELVAELTGLSQEELQLLEKP